MKTEGKEAEYLGKCSFANITFNVYPTVFGKIPQNHPIDSNGWMKTVG